MIAYEFLEHLTGLKVHATGKTEEDMHIHAAQALMHYLFDDAILEKQATTIEYLDVAGHDRYSLLTVFLTELLYLCHNNKSACTELEIISYEAEQRIVAKVGLLKAEKKAEIKEVTYAEINIKHTKRDWQVVFVCKTN